MPTSRASRCHVTIAPTALMEQLRSPRHISVFLLLLKAEVLVPQAELAQKDKLLQHISGAAGAAANALPSPLRGVLQQKTTPSRRAGPGADGRTAAKAPNPTPPRFSRAPLPAEVWPAMPLRH